MDISPVNGLRGGSLDNPRRTGGIAVVRLEAAAAGNEVDDGSSSRRHAPDSGPGYEDAEFIEISEDDEPVAVTPRKGGHIHLLA